MQFLLTSVPGYNHTALKAEAGLHMSAVTRLAPDLTRNRQEVLAGVCTARSVWGARPVAGAPAPPHARRCSACRTAARLPLRRQQAPAQTLSELLVQGAGLRRVLAVQQDSGSAAAPALGLCEGSALAQGRCLCRWT